MILACQNISKAFGTTEIIKNASFHIEEREKAALVGINGAGKSTLLKIIIGEMRADEGEVILSKGKTMGYLAQHQDLTGHLSIYQEVLTAKQNLIDMEERLRQMESDMNTKSGAELDELLSTYTRLSHTFELENGYAYRSEVVGVLKGLGFSESDFEKQVDSLSGGQKTRVALGKLLLTKPDIILLDEPTNHLDMDSISWLETYLLNYSGAVLIVSHDRYFLDRVVTKVVEVDNKKVTTFEGNYTAYSQKKAMLREAAYHAWVNQQQEIHHQEEVIAKLKSFNREKSIKRAESREKMLDKMDVLEKPTEVRSDMRIRLEPRITSGNDVLTVEHLSKAFPGQTLFQDLNFEIKRGERVAIIGNNGTGKTTILKILNEVIRPDVGSFTLGSRVQIGYYDQEHQVLHMEKTIFQEISDAYPYLTNTEIRNVLAAFLFTNDDVFQPIHTLSGGERGRISLAKLMLSNANFLILDEPTNHLDIVSKEILENALKDYTGTVLYVSHDRYFINQTATRILELTGQTLVNYIGNYDYYLEKKEELTRIYAPAADAAAPEEAAAPSEASSTKLDWKAQKEEQARLRKKENELKKTEKRIEELETRDSEIDEEMSKPEVATNVAECVKLSKEKAEIAAELEELYEKWEELVRPNTRALVVTGASNVTGNCTDLAKAAAFAHRHGLLLIVDAAQTAGAQSIDVQALGVDVLCFTGHKALLGPQGTGGLYVRPGVQIAPLVVGGSGVHSYDEQHPAQMPTALEAGTLNVHGLAGLCAGVQWLLTQGVETLAAREAALARCFYEEVCGMPGVTVYGDIETALRAPIVSLNIGDEDSARVADILWEDYGICVRAGAHCAPLMHKALGTVEQGVVRFSFSHSNTMEEALHAAQAVRELVQEL